VCQAATRTTKAAKPKWQRHWPTWRMSNSTLTPQRRAWFCLQPHTHTQSHPPRIYTHTHTWIQRDICLRSLSVCFMFCVIVASSKNTKIFISNESCAQLGTAETGKQNDFSAQPPAATPTKRPREIPCKWVESMICPNLLISYLLDKFYRLSSAFIITKLTSGFLRI